VRRPRRSPDGGQSSYLEDRHTPPRADGPRPIGGPAGHAPRSAGPRYLVWSETGPPMTCRHPACACPRRSLLGFCADICAETVDQVEVCRCGHVECGGAKQPSLAV
jgi:hypothetical protein